MVYRKAIYSNVYGPKRPMTHNYISQKGNGKLGDFFRNSAKSIGKVANRVKSEISNNKIARQIIASDAFKRGLELAKDKAKDLYDSQVRDKVLRPILGKELENVERLATDIAQGDNVKNSLAKATKRAVINEFGNNKLSQDAGTRLSNLVNGAGLKTKRPILNNAQGRPIYVEMDRRGRGLNEQNPKDMISKEAGPL